MTAVPNRARMLGRWMIALALLAMVGASPLAMTARAQDTDLGELEGEIAADGSSTVGPITAAVAEEFTAEASNVEISVDVSGTGGGFERFCNGETDLQDASREIEDDEIALCEENGVDYFVFQVAFDGITVVVNEENDYLTCLNLEGLQSLFGADGATTFADLDPDFPDTEISAFTPGTDSGTYDFFVEAALADGEPRDDAELSEDDNVIVEGVSGEEGGVGYFGYAFFENNQDALNAVAIDAEGDCSGGGVAPSPETIRDGSYQPLSRPLYVYAKAESLERPEVQEFMRFYIENAGELATDVGFVASPDEVYEEDTTKIEDAIGGSAEPDGPAGAGGSGDEATPEA